MVVKRPKGGGRYLASLRETAGFDLESAARRSGLTAERLAAIEEDRVGPWLLEVAMLARTYERSVDEIADGWLTATRRN
jgi:transcriptional regulator with XRE-family HTH domain